MLACVLTCVWSMVTVLCVCACACVGVCVCVCACIVRACVRACMCPCICVFVVHTCEWMWRLKTYQLTKTFVTVLLTYFLIHFLFVHLVSMEDKAT